MPTVTPPPEYLKIPDSALRNQPADRVIPLKKWEDFHDYPNEAQWRWILHQHRKNKAFQRVFRKVNGRILIIEHQWFQWCGILTEQQGVRRNG